MRCISVLFCFCAFVLPLSTLADESIYRWVDQHGQTHYGGYAAIVGHQSVAESVFLSRKTNVIKPFVAPDRLVRPGRAKSAEKTPAKVPISQAPLRCEQARNKLKKTRARLRAGYKYRQYTRLHEQERRYRAQSAAYCR